MSVHESFRRRHLPHWDVPHAAYFVTSCLEGSIPARGLLDIERYRSNLEQEPRPASCGEREWASRCWKKMFVRREKWLDGEPAARHLEDAQLARIVVDALYFFAGQRYDLLAFVVMPSHLHWVFQPLESWVSGLEKANQHTPRARIVHSINRYTAKKCNEFRGRSGPFWQHEPYDHWVRNVDELERIMRYIEENPVKAGLARVPEEWPFSSAHDRNVRRLEWGEPLV